MTGISTIAHALIYIPAFHTLDGHFAQQCYDHCRRRGYDVTAIVRDWASVQHLLGRRTASVVVMAPTTADDGPTERLLPRAGEGTRDLSSYACKAKLVRNGRRPESGWTRNEVATVLDGDGPVPAGLDPDSIAALRFIARRLND